jgi:hypothetical protein
MDWVCSTHGSDKKYIRHILSKDVKERGHLGDLDEDGTLMIKELGFYEC